MVVIVCHGVTIATLLCGGSASCFVCETGSCEEGGGFRQERGQIRGQRRTGIARSLPLKKSFLKFLIIFGTLCNSLPHHARLRPNRTQWQRSERLNGRMRCKSFLGTPLSSRPGLHKQTHSQTHRNLQQPGYSELPVRLLGEPTLHRRHGDTDHPPR